MSPKPAAKVLKRKAAREARKWTVVVINPRDPSDWPAAYGAAYLLIEAAFVKLASTAKGLEISLSPKDGSTLDLAKELGANYEYMRNRWQGGFNDRLIREEILKSGLALASLPADAPARLDPAQEAEIAALLDDAERHPVVDEEAIKTPWSELKNKP